MTDHSTFEEMVARRDELSAPEEAALRDHLLVCVACKHDAEIYAEQDSLLRMHAEAEPVDERAIVVRTRVRQAIGRRQTHGMPILRHTIRALPVAAVLTIGAAFALHSYLPTGHSVARPNPVSPTQPGPRGTPGAKTPATPGTTMPKTRRWRVSGVRLLRPDGNARVDRRRAERVTHRRWPGIHIRKVVLAHVRAPNMPAVNGRLCWVVFGRGRLPAAGHGNLAVFVDAHTGRFVLAAASQGP